MIPYIPLDIGVERSLDWYLGSEYYTVFPEEPISPDTIRDSVTTRQEEEA